MTTADAVEVPRYFICPISLHIMKDPVTATTGITYDRHSIERWLFVDRRRTCPVTNSPLPADPDLTPNHTLRRLIQSWCSLHSLDRIPTPRPPADLPTVLNLLRELSPRSLSLLHSLASESESNRRCILRAGAADRLISFVSRSAAAAAEPAVSLLLFLRVPPDVFGPLVADNSDLADALRRHLIDTLLPAARSNAIVLLKAVFELATPKLLERLRVEFFREVVGALRARISAQAALQVLLQSTPWGTNRMKIVEAGAVAEIVELELTAPEKRTTELGLAVLEQLCMCADGRAEFLGHAAGVAVVAKRMIRVSPAADEKAVGILTAVARNSATAEVVQEMLRVGAVGKLCLVMQAECLSGVKEKARWVLRLHSGLWRSSPCINSYLLSIYP